MKRIIILSSIILCCSFIPVAAQETEEQSEIPAYAGGFLENFGAAVKFSTYGLGVDFMTALHPNIKVRAGVSYAGFLHLNLNKEFDGSSTDGSNRDVPVHVDKISTDFLNANLLFDLFPWRSGGFHFTIGAYFGKSHIPVSGQANEEFEVEGYIIRPDASGNFRATLELGNFVKPYFGIGFGRTIPKSRVGVKFDLGVVYQGAYKITSSNMNTDDLNNTVNDELNSQLDNAGIPKIVTELWPMMTLSIIYRIK